MSEKQNEKVKPKNKSFIGRLSGLVFNMILLFLLAWFLLIIWFQTLSFFRGTNEALYTMQHIIQISSFYVGKKIVWLNHSINYLSSTVSNLANIMNGYFYRFICQFDCDKAIAITSKYQSHVSTFFTIVYKAFYIVLSRAVIFILNLPFLMSLLFISLIDGLAQRDIRKFQGARESTFLFHKIRLLIGSIFLLVYLIYLSYPYAVQPWVFLIPISVVISILFMISIRNFKKYV